MWQLSAWRKAMFGTQSNLNSGWVPCIPTSEALIDAVLAEPEGGIIGTVKGEELRAMVYGR